MENGIVLTIIDMENKVQTAVGIAGIISGVFLYLTPMKIVIRIAEERSSEKLSVTPYFLAYLNCVFYMGYTAWSSNWLAVIANALDALIVFHYVMIFMFLSPINLIAYKRVGALLVVFVVLVTFIFVPLSMHEHLGLLFNGLVATAFSIALYITSLFLVIQRKEVEFMSFYTSILMLLNGAFWFVFGLLRQDFFIVLLNGVGCGVGAAQIYLMYPNNKGKTVKKGGENKTKIA
ncbi:PREDICTED: bidirectional sugar transporter SWEET1-like isoform X2 [Erythranthe guttata]|uniref:bidirectional sugar transporter SWEET1-like isoform X2 n=1 Tax=Erythranthe guttata TaxID=4155 RepID=UPI00064E0B07|nr:PREDICTED: bidirectional sugar transporter SWEET1-like isoform X2 [Erythranthe guttata]|eukprot:XP_012854451.1 PREDICTED: bidirectional sugar transporter SWEET1-like isoform X2 [Erythranthe guttata]